MGARLFSHPFLLVDSWEQILNKLTVLRDAPERCAPHAGRADVPLLLAVGGDVDREGKIMAGTRSCCVGLRIFAASWTFMARRHQLRFCRSSPSRHCRKWVVRSMGAHDFQGFLLPSGGTVFGSHRLSTGGSAQSGRDCGLRLAGIILSGTSNQPSE